MQGACKVGNCVTVKDCQTSNSICDNKQCVVCRTGYTSNGTQCVGDLPLTVVLPDNTNLAVRIATPDMLSELKKIVEQQKAYKQAEQHYFFNCQELPSNKTFKEMGIVASDTVYLKVYTGLSSAHESCKTLRTLGKTSVTEPFSPQQPLGWRWAPSTMRTSPL